LIERLLKHPIRKGDESLLQTKIGGAGKSLTYFCFKLGIFKNHFAINYY